MSSPGPDFALQLVQPPLPKGSGSRRLIPVPCPKCKRKSPGFGRLGGFHESADKKTKTRPADSLKKQGKKIAAAAAVTYDEPIKGPVEVRLQFRFVKPKSVKRSHPECEADIDKLMRTVFDALSKIAFEDDARVCQVFATKVYADSPGVAVRVRPL